MKKNIATFIGGMIVASIAMLTGCDSQPLQPPKTEKPKVKAIAEAPQPVGLPGNIKVSIQFEGKAPKAKRINRKADPYCAKTKKIDPSIIVKNGKLQNVVVRILGKVKGKKVMPAAEPLKITQTECMYEPRVLATVVGQEISVNNGDMTLHNVHAYKGANRENWFNSAQPPKAQAIKKKLPKGMIQFKCDVHPWMSAFISTAEHPFNTVAAQDGTVSWTGVPSKSKPYMIEAWHEVYGIQTAEVTVKANETAEVTLIYRAAQGS